MNRCSQVTSMKFWAWTLGSGLVLLANNAAADDFTENVAPILNQNCVACHNTKTPEGGLNLESFEPMMAGGDSGAAIVAGDPDTSELIARIRATDDSMMPPADNGVGAKPLTEAQIEQLTAWIRAGATPPSKEIPRSIQWRDISEAVRPIYALRTSGDGYYLSFAKGNIAYLVGNPLAQGTWQPTPLVDAALKLPDGTPLAATDKDLIHSLAFSHDSQRLAVGGYRTVKIWQRKTTATSSDTPRDPSLRYIPIGGGGTWRVAQDQAKSLLVFPNEDPNSKLVIGQVENDTVAAAWSKDHTVLWVFDDSNQLWRWRPDATGSNSSWIADRITVAEPITDLLALVMTEPQQLLIVTKSGQVLKLIDEGATWRHELAFGLEPSLKTVSVSPDARMLVAIDTQNTASVWNIENGQKRHTLGLDYERWQAQQQMQRQIARQEGWVKRLTEMIPGLEEAIKKEEEARTKVAETHQKAMEAQQAKEQEIAAAQQVVTETEQSIAALEQQLAEKKQQLVERQKAVADLQPQLVTSQQNVAKAMQALTSADAGLQLARDKVPAQQNRIETHRQALLQQQQSLEQISKATRGEMVTATFDAYSQQVLLLTSTGHGLLYRTDSGQPVAVLQPPADSAGTTIVAADTKVALNQIATVQNEQRTWHWNLSLPWELERTWGNENDELFSSRVTALAFSPDDRYLAVGSGPPSRFGDLKELEVGSGAVKRDYGQVHSDTILAIEYSPDGKWLATAGADKLCRLHDPQTGAMIKILEGHTHFVQALSWQNQAQQLATASADKTVKTWDVETGERRQSITGFGKEISAIAYVGDSGQLVSVSLDGHTRLHNGDNAQLVRNYAHNPQPLYALSLSSDGKHVLVGDHDGKIRIYQVEDAQLVRQWPE
jgi:WD40 repeat protein